MSELTDEQLSISKTLSALLEYAGARSDASEISHGLVNDLNTYKAILSTKAEVFKQRGLMDEEIVLLKLVHSVVRGYYTSLLASEVKDRYDQQRIKQYLITHYSKLPKERLVLIMYDAEGGLIKESVLTTGASNYIGVNLRVVLEEVLPLGTRSLLIAHNHPSGYAKPSIQDEGLTSTLRHQLEKVEVELIDHLVIGNNHLYSIMSSKYI